MVDQGQPPYSQRMATKPRTRKGVVHARQANRAAKLQHRGDATVEAAGLAKSAPADRVATADEVRAAGERAAARWGSLLKRLAE